MEIPSGYDIARDLVVEHTRLPDQVARYRQWKVHEDGEVLVSTFHETEVPAPATPERGPVVEGPFFGIVYHFWDEWFNVIRIYDEDMGFRGYYSDVITPVQKQWNRVMYTDLFLDVMLFEDGEYVILDEDEFEQGVADGLMDEGVARRAKETVEAIVSRIDAGDWPPDVVHRLPADPLRELRVIGGLQLP